MLIYDLRDVRNRGVKPRVHGNGFIQLDLANDVRMHVWGDDRIPKQVTETPVHDHMFAFRSFVLRGSLFNRQFMWMESRDIYDHIQSTHMVHRAQVREKEDTVLMPTGELGRLALISEHEVTRSYQMTPLAIHESVAEALAVTVIVKQGLTLAQGGASPRVFVPLGVKPDNDFNRYATSEDKLWQIIHEAIGNRVEVPYERPTA